MALDYFGRLRCHFPGVSQRPLWLNFFMRHTLALMIFGLLLAGCAGESKHPSWSNSTSAEQHERLMWKAIQDKDWSNVERHLSPTFVGVNAAGQVFDRSGWVAYWKSSPLQDFSLGEISVHPEGPDMKVTYIFHLQGTSAGAEPAPGLQIVSVWQQYKTGWMLTATALTPIQGS